MRRGLYFILSYKLFVGEMEPYMAENYNTIQELNQSWGKSMTILPFLESAMACTNKSLRLSSLLYL